MDAYDYVFGQNAALRRATLNIGNVWYKHGGIVRENESRDKVIAKIDWIRRMAVFTDGDCADFAQLSRDYVCKFDEFTAMPIKKEVKGLLTIPREASVFEDPFLVLPRTAHLLERMNIETIGDLVDIGARKIRNARACGVKTMNDIVKMLTKAGADIDDWMSR